MNTDPSAAKVLCFGDSNTWGSKPDRTGRYDVDIRWTGALQNLLGDAYYVIEEGLGSRTTDLDYGRKPGRNGRTYLIPCLASHSPVDVVVIMLGTNDLKIEYSRTAREIAIALKKLVDDVKDYALNKRGEVPAIILISPIIVDDNAPRFKELYQGYYDSRAASESLKLAYAINSIAEENDCIFVNAAEVARPGVDGIHLSEDSNKPLADSIVEAIKIYDL